MGKQFYRFRSLDSLLGDRYQELERQTIYFASPEQLNDPMEGFKNLIFNGDSILYKNLFKHYLMCLERVSSLYIIAGEDYHKITSENIPFYNGFEDFPTPMYKELFDEISNDFFDLLEDYIEAIAKRSTPIKRDELSTYLDTIHIIAIEIIHKNYEKKNLLPQRGKSEEDNINIKNNSEIVNSMIKSIEYTEKILKEKDGLKKVNTLMSIQKQTHEELTLINNAQHKYAVNLPNKNFIFIDFVNIYLENLEKLMYPNWYTACFMTENHNSSIWGHYGDNHKGVCLIFESENESLKLSDLVVGWSSTSGDIIGENTFKFQQVTYEKGHPEIDFFRSIGRLPISKLYSTWYMRDGEISSISNDFEKNQENWRKNHWDKFYKNILTKTKDWNYEKEYRLILSSGLDGEIKKEKRTLTYNFFNLKGIIFGIKTPIEDKLKIIDIIGEKCKLNSRKDFEFYQAYYCHENKNIQHRKLGLIKFNHNRTL